MRRSSIWSDPRVKPPYGSVEIDWVHPLANRLQALYLFNEGGGVLKNLVTGRATTLFGAPTWLGTINGPGVSFGISNYYRDAAFVTPASTDLSVAIQLQTAANGFFFGSNANGNWSLYNDNTNGLIRFYGNTNFGQGQSASGLTPNVFETLVVSFTNTGLVTKFYRNGLDISSSNSAHAIQAITGVNIGADVVNGYCVHQETGAAIWFRPLTLNDAKWLTAEPYAYLRPVIRRRYFVPAGAAGVSGTRISLLQWGHGV